MADSGAPDGRGLPPNSRPAPPEFLWRRKLHLEIAHRTTPDAVAKDDRRRPRIARTPPLTPPEPIRGDSPPGGSIGLEDARGCRWIRVGARLNGTQRPPPFHAPHPTAKDKLARFGRLNMPVRQRLSCPTPTALIDIPVRAWQIPGRRSWRHSGQMIEAEGACGSTQGLESIVNPR